MNVSNLDSEHMILRLPQRLAESLNKDLSDVAKLEKKFSIHFNNESRGCTIHYNDNDINGMIVNLPNEACIAKTTDTIAFSNLFPVKHMILVEDNPRTKYTKDFILKDGINPPLKNINILKYRKPKKKQSVKMMKMIKDMLLADSKADSVWYKMVPESDDEQIEVRDTEYIRAESERIEIEKRKAKEAKEQMIAIQNSSEEESDDDSNDNNSNSTSDDSNIYLTEDECEDDVSTDDDDFEDY